LFTFCDYDANCMKFRQNPAGSAHLHNTSVFDFWEV